MRLIPVVMAGGLGTRLWPLSRRQYPKQFLPLVGDRTLLQETIMRLGGFPDVAPPVVVCNEEHRFLVAEQLRQIGTQPDKVILEPVGRNTAPALALAALSIKDRTGGDPIMIAMPADHTVTERMAFQQAVQAGLSFANEGCLVTFGGYPERPDTGYGYLRIGDEIHPNGSVNQGEIMPLELRNFVEKPDLDTASKYVDSGEYLWNSGIFMMRVSVMLQSLQLFRDDILSACMNSYSKATFDGDFVRPSPAEFEKCPTESFDYAVMERVTAECDSDDKLLETSFAKCVVIPLSTSWSDVGTWSALLDDQEKDQDGNVLHGDVYALSTKNSLIRSEFRLLTTVGLEDSIVVETADAVLVAHKNHVQDVKQIAEILKKNQRSEYNDHRKVHRPWGTYEILDKGHGFQVKRLTIKPGSAISLQKHLHRSEHWVVVKGKAKVTVGDEEMTLSANQSTYVSKGTVHRLENTEEQELHIIEVQSGEYLEEDDITRFDDKYDRETQEEEMLGGK